MRLFPRQLPHLRPSAPTRDRHRRRCRPSLEGLETRRVLSTYTVVLATDAGPSAGQGITATTGDLRWCINQADMHPSSASTITFDPTLFATPQTITLDNSNNKGTLVIGAPLTITGPTGGTATLSGGDAVGIVNVTSGNVNISNLTFSHGNAVEGGGVEDSENTGTLTLTGCNFDHDVATAGGGLAIRYSEAEVKGCVFNEVSAPLGGGGIFTDGMLKLTDSVISNASAPDGNGGALYISPDGNATVSGCTFTNDSTIEDGGVVFLNGLAAWAKFTGCTMTDDSAGNGGGAVCTDGNAVTLKRCTISDDTAAQGGGVCNTQGTVTLTQCTLANDSASGFLNEGTATVTACTFSNDTASGGGGMSNGGLATVTNCTFSNDTATYPAGGGGAIYNWAYLGVPATLTVLNCTIARNVAVSGSGGGIDNVSGNTLNLTNTIVAEDTAAGSGPDISGSINTADHNLIGDVDGATIVTDLGGNLEGGDGNPVIDPRLGPLQNNGGPTQTMALMRDSLAIGHADDAKAPSTDQRGHSRVDHFGLATDIGAYEYP
jgi:hypothetical protein